MIPRELAASGGSRTAAYLVAGALATVPVALLLGLLIGIPFAIGTLVVAWASGILWLLNKRQEDPFWDHRPTSCHR